MAINYYDSFIKKLQELFMMDHAELDFGIYRIMNQKRADINHFLKFELLPQVKTVLTNAPDGSDNEVFSHLVTFFSRYYDNGDFISKRRYKENTYAIPYNGEEVKLHWANADQYYIKSSEYFRNYSFVLPTSRRKVHFVLKNASTEQNNNKATNDKERRFALYKPEVEGELFYEVNGEELNIFFTYELMPKSIKQNDLMAEAIDSIKEIIPGEFMELLNVKSPTDKNANRTLLEKHLTDYTAKNSFDYFIHKDLGGFLRRELDFYIKNEVMLLDDLDVQHIESQLSIIKAIKLVGEKIIRMLAQLEDFQKKLWLKKKFVVQSDYCITLDRVPHELYPEILANDRQREEWVRLFAIDEIKGDMLTEGYSEPLTMAFLEQNPFLVLDTAFFSKQFKHKLVAHLGDKGIDKQCNGLLINSENFQALELLQEKFSGRINGIYIDPPYNTNASEIVYKNGYKSSSWTTLLYDRVLRGRNFLSNEGIFCATIDDFQIHEFYYVLSQAFGKDNRLSTVVIKSNPSGRSTTSGFSIAHEYGLFFAKDSSICKIGRLERNDEQIQRYKESDDKGNFEWVNFRARYSTDSPSLQYPIFIKKDGSGFRIPNMSYDHNKYELNESVSDDEFISYPIDSNGNMRSWKWSRESILTDRKNDVAIRLNQDKQYAIYAKSRMKDEGMLPLTWWEKSDYSATSQGNNLLESILGKNQFNYPKSLYAVIDSLKVESQKVDAFYLDYFAGSGTTGHAVICLNRVDKGSRKYILVEVNHYFDSATRARIEKVIYSPDWKDGKPVSRQGISQCFKYMRLEQYEDTLNNLKINNQQTKAQFEDGGGFKESYMLEYMLDVETRDSLLNLKMFENPFAMTLKTTKDNELVETDVDMVETFNYLIGLNVETEDWYKNENMCVVQGHTHRDNLHTLVIWRNCKEIDNKTLEQFFERMDFRTRDSEFDLIYVNGDNTLPNLRRDEDHWKVVLIEEESQSECLKWNNTNFLCILDRFLYFCNGYINTLHNDNEYDY